MSRSATARTESDRTHGSTATALFVIAAVIAGTLFYQSAWASAPALEGVDRGDPGDTTTVIRGTATETSHVVRSPATATPTPSSKPPGATTTEANHPSTEADGALPEGVTVFDEEYPGVANLDPDLLDAIRVAAGDAAEDSVVFYVNSGWRSPEYEDRLHREAVAQYGSEEEAARWVATGDTSAHVSGDAIDIGHSDATAWLSEHGATYGLCQIYLNEPWHYELRPDAIDDGCPAMYADPTHDPRMDQ